MTPKFQNLSFRLGTTVLLLLCFLGVTNPTQVPTILLLVPFLLLFWVLSQVLVCLLWAGSSWAGVPLEYRRIEKIALLIASFPVAVLVMQSVGQITIREIALLAVLFLVLYVYTARAVPLRRSKTSL